MSKHDVENVHPECSLLDGGAHCTCIEASGYVDDTVTALAIAERQEARSNPARFVGATKDADEPGEVSPGGGDTGLLSEGVERGFWKESERLRCEAGIDFAGGEMEFPIKRDPSSTWARAAESMK